MPARWRFTIAVVVFLGLALAVQQIWGGGHGGPTWPLWVGYAVIVALLIRNAVRAESEPLPPAHMGALAIWVYALVIGGSTFAIGFANVPQWVVLLVVGLAAAGVVWLDRKLSER